MNLLKLQEKQPSQKVFLQKKIMDDFKLKQKPEVIQNSCQNIFDVERTYQTQSQNFVLKGIIMADKPYHILGKVQNFNQTKLDKAISFSSSKEYVVEENSKKSQVVGPIVGKKPFVAKKQKSPEKLEIAQNQSQNNQVPEQKKFNFYSQFQKDEKIFDKLDKKFQQNMKQNEENEQERQKKLLPSFSIPHTFQNRTITQFQNYNKIWKSSSDFFSTKTKRDISASLIPRSDKWRQKQEIQNTLHLIDQMQVRVTTKSFFDNLRLYKKEENKIQELQKRQTLLEFKQDKIVDYNLELVRSANHNIQNDLHSQYNQSSDIDLGSQKSKLEFSKSHSILKLEDNHYENRVLQDQTYLEYRDAKIQKYKNVIKRIRSPIKEQEINKLQLFGLNKYQLEKEYVEKNQNKLNVKQFYDQPAKIEKTNEIIVQNYINRKNYYALSKQNEELL